MSPKPWPGALARLALAAWAFASLQAATAAHAEDSGLAPLRAAATATIDLQEGYTAVRTLDGRGIPADIPAALPTLSLPYRSVVAALLKHAGVEVLPETASAADLRITVISHGTTRGQLYDAASGGQRIRELRYTDATLDGELRLAAGASALTRSFSGQVAPAVTIIGIVDGSDHRRDPHYAPFRDAFEIPGGFLDVLGALVLEVWGDGPLRAAAADRDPLVRAVAARAADRLPK